MIRRIVPLLALLLTGATTQPTTQDAHSTANYDENKVVKFTLDDPLTLSNGQKVTDAQTWFKLRRPELLKLVQENIYGISPPAPAGMHFDVVDEDRQARDGNTVRKQVTISFAGFDQGPKISLLMYLPGEATKAVPVFLCLSFTPLQSVDPDPDIKLMDQWVSKTHDRHAGTDAMRGTSHTWKIDEVLSRGYGIAFLYYQQIEPDFQGGLPFGVRSMFLKPGQTEFADDEWGSIGAWAWGASRALDYLQTDPDVDGQRVAIMGQSRLGKTAVWEGASDPRFAMVIACNSGRGGASLGHRNYGETIKHLNDAFPYQFCASFRKYGLHTDQLPVDSHDVLALIAPRPVYLTTGSLDTWSDPHGEFLAAVAAGPVFKLLGADPLDTDVMPPLDTPIMHTIAFHCHTGKHEINEFDWDQILKFADLHLKTPN
jgi:hypothetical protein